MKSNFVWVAALFAASACAQSMVEHAAAAAGAAMGVGGGKVLSNALNKTMDQAAQVAEAPAQAKRKAPTAPQPAQKAASSGDPAGKPDDAPAPAATPKRGRAARPLARALGRPVFAASADRLDMRAERASVAPLAPSPEDFAKLKEGASREEVLTALGVPSSHVTIPDEGHLIEILSYQDAGRRIGSVRLDNGQAVSIMAR